MSMFPTDLFEKPGSHGPIQPDFSRDSIIDYVRARLGYPLVEVELDLLNYDVAIEEAFETYSRYHPRFCRTNLTVDSSIKRYRLPYVGRGITEVQPSRGSSFLVPGSAFSINLGDGVISTVVPAFRDSYGIDEIYEVLGYSEMWRRVLSWDFQWEGEGGYLWIHNIVPEISEVSIIYSEDHDYVSLPRPDRDWIKRFCLALCKQMMGEVRGKFSIPGPAGQQMVERRAELIGEGKEEEAALRAEMSARAWPLPPTWDDKP